MNPPTPEESGVPFVVRRHFLLLLGVGALVVIAFLLLGSGRASALGVSTPATQSVAGTVASVTDAASSDATTAVSNTTTIAAAPSIAAATPPATVTPTPSAPLASASHPPTPTLEQPASLPSLPGSLSGGTGTTTVTQATQPVAAAVAQSIQPVVAVAQPVAGAVAQSIQPVVAVAQPVAGAVAQSIQPVVAVAQPVAGAVAQSIQPVVAVAQPVAGAVAQSIIEPVTQPVLAATRSLAATGAGTASTIGQVLVGGIAPVTEPATTDATGVLDSALDSVSASALDSVSASGVGTVSFLQPVTNIVTASPRPAVTGTLVVPPRGSTSPAGEPTDAAVDTLPAGAGAQTGNSGATSSAPSSESTPVGSFGGPTTLVPLPNPVVCGTSTGTSPSAPANAALTPISSPNPGRVPPSHDLLLWLLGSGHGSLDSSSANGSSAHGSLFANLSKPALWTWSSRRIVPGTVPDPGEVFFPITEQPG